MRFYFQYPFFRSQQVSGHSADLSWAGRWGGGVRPGGPVAGGMLPGAEHPSVVLGGNETLAGAPNPGVSP